MARSYNRGVKLRELPERWFDTHVPPLWRLDYDEAMERDGYDVIEHDEHA